MIKAAGRSGLHRHADLLSAEHGLPVLDFGEHDVIGRVHQFGDAAVVKLGVGASASNAMRAWTELSFSAVTSEMAAKRSKSPK